MKRIALTLIVALLLTFSVVATTGAANPTITITVTARVVSISNTPSSWDFELVDSASTYETGLTCFNTTNDGNCEVDISISGSNMTGSGFTWELSDTATPSDMVYGLKVGLSGGNYTIIVKLNSPYNYLAENLTVDSSQQWGLKIWTPTDYDDGNDKTGTVTITAAYSS